ncbi:MAG: hypothetical protein HY286_15065 [Planctomycetes bacterium]|nr:hypothetical protein [Planctomycetota bacterium]
MSDIEINKLRSYARDLRADRSLFISREDRPRNVDGVEILPWTLGINSVLEE